MDTDGIRGQTVPPTTRPAPLIPPHIGWPALVILLLLIGIGSAFAALWAASSDGGAILVRDAEEQVDR